MVAPLTTWGKQGIDSIVGNHEEKFAFFSLQPLKAVELMADTGLEEAQF